MGKYTKSAELIAEKLRDKADVFTFSPVFDCRSELLENICLALGGRILCFLPSTPSEKYRSRFCGGNRFFIGASLEKSENLAALHAVKELSHCVLFASLSMLKQDILADFLNETDFTAALLLHAQRSSPLCADFDKRMLLFRDLRAQLQKTLPLCAFCAADTSAFLRDLSAALTLKTPSRVYPGVENICCNLLTDATVPAPAALENTVRKEGIRRMFVYCADRQTAEDACRYFRFFGYKCSIAHGGLSYEQNRRARNRFADGETDMLFATSGTAVSFSTLPYETATIGLPKDVFAMQSFSHPDRNIYVHFTKEHITQNIYQTEEENERRSTYTAMPSALLLQERLYMIQQLETAVQNKETPFALLQKLYPQIYYNADKNLESEN